MPHNENPERQARAEREKKSPASAELAKIVPLSANVRGFRPPRRKYSTTCRHCMGAREIQGALGNWIRCPHCAS